MQTMTIEGETPEIFLKNFTALANRLGFYAREQMQAAAQRAAQANAPTAEKPTPPQPVPAAEPAKPLDGEVIPPEKTKRGRPPKAAAEKPAEKAAEEPAPALTTDHVRAAMRDLAGRTSVQRVTDLLAEFGAASASGIPEDRIAEFVEKAKAAP